MTMFPAGSGRLECGPFSLLPCSCHSPAAGGTQPSIPVYLVFPPNPPKIVGSPTEPHEQSFVRALDSSGG